MGRAERAHLSIQGFVRTLILDIEERYQVKVTPQSVLIPWMWRFAAWTLDRFQIKANGKTAYFSKRGKNCESQNVPFAATVLYNSSKHDKFEERWSKGIYVGRVERTDETILLTAEGVKKSRSV